MWADDAMIWLRRILLWGLLAALVAAGIAAATLRFDHVHVPPETALLNRERLPAAIAFDVLGRPVSAGEAEDLRGQEAGRQLLSPASGAVRIDDALVAAGRDAFYRETFGNEDFLTDVLGFLDGGLSVPRLAFALVDLGGRGTTNLSVKLARDVTVGDRVFRSGEAVATGLQVPAGAAIPLGLRVFYDRGGVRVGFTCALCHAALDPASGKVVEGAPNRELNLGLLLALSSNPSALFPYAGVGSLGPYLTRPENIVITRAGPSAVLPDPAALHRDVRAALGAWPRGSVDTTPDGVANPTSIPSGFAAEAHPYGWSGQAAIGPLRGLWSIAGDLHGFAVDPTARAWAAPVLFGVDPEVYLGAMLQRSAESAYRFDPRDGRKPSAILAEAHPDRGTPGLSRVAKLPGFPRADYLTSAGLVPVRAGEPVGAALDALAAFGTRLRPPDAAALSTAELDRGRQVFDRAGCLACHSGPALTSHRVWPAAVIGTEPSRAVAFAKSERDMAPPRTYAGDTPVPPPSGAGILPVPIPDEGQLKLAWGHNRTGGGYKVMGLLGLAWTAPYLHDGGVAIGPDPDRGAGVPGTSGAGVQADPANSLRALVDRTWRARAVAANRADPAARLARVTGEGHAFWVDAEAGFKDDERDALVRYLLSIDRLQPQPAPDLGRPAPP